MIALTMIYATLIGLACAVGAWLAERAATFAGRSARWAWMAALAMSVALPAATLWRAWRDTAHLADTAIERVAVALPGVGSHVTHAPTHALLAWWPLWRDTLAALLPATVAAPTTWAALDRGLLVLWGALTVGIVLRTSTAAARTRRIARQWPARTLLGVPVRVSRDTGPAVVGVWRPEIVVPGWALDDARLPLMLTHECEHERARDPWLLTAGVLAVALVPWSPAAWWSRRRLRAAVEVDCDRRVLARHQTASGAHAASDAQAVVRAYGALLVDVAARPHARASAIMLGGTPTLLRRRIETMLSDRQRAPWRAILPASAAVATIALACDVPRPIAPGPVTRAPLTRVPLTNAPVADAAVAPIPEPDTPVDEVRRVIASRLPELLATPTGHRQRVWVVQRADGSIAEVTREDDNARAQRIAFGHAQLVIDDSSKVLRVKGVVEDSRTVVVTPGGPTPLAAIDPGRIGTIELLRIPPGRVAPDSLTVVWVRLRPATARAASAYTTSGAATRLGASVNAGSGRIKLDVRAGGVPNGISSTPLDPPLVILDGREIAGGMAALPDPAHLARVDVLKGATAVREYGQRAALGGVIRVTTRSDSTSH